MSYYIIIARYRRDNFRRTWDVPDLTEQEAIGLARSLVNDGDPTLLDVELHEAEPVWFAERDDLGPRCGVTHFEWIESQRAAR
jgi:hypothetical protein